jgi:hypothetical protein
MNPEQVFVAYKHHETQMTKHFNYLAIWIFTSFSDLNERHKVYLSIENMEDKPHRF